MKTNLKLTIILSLLGILSPASMYSQQSNFEYGDDFNYASTIEWQDHLPYNRAISVVAADNLIYCATPYSIFHFDKTNGQTSKLSKVNGLSDIGVSCISYSDEHNTLLIAYTNCNIDLIKDGEIINISDIKRKQILGKKTINNIHFSDSLAYLACGFGIVVLDIKNEVFPEPIYYIGPDGSHVDVLDITIGADSIFAATESGIYKASATSPNLPHHTSWIVDQRMKPDESFNVIQYFDNKLIVNYENQGYQQDTTFYYDFTSHEWNVLPNVDHYRKLSFRTNGEKLIITGYGSVRVLDNNLSVIEDIHFLSADLNPKDATFDNTDTLWVADYSLGLVKAIDNSTGSFITINGPYSDNVFDMSIGGNSLWVTSGGRTSGWGKIYLRDGVYVYNGQTWDSYNRSNGFNVFDTISDMTCVAVDPTNKNHAFVGTWGGGVIEFLDGEVINVFDHNNSSLQKWLATNYVAISGLAFDSNNNLWAVNSGASRIISVKEPNGNWTSFWLSSSGSGIDIGKMIVDRDNQKWVLMREEHSLLVFSDNNTISNPNDDHTKILTNASGNGNLSGTKIYSLSQDNEGQMWIGTDEGVLVISNPDNVFTGGNYDAWRPMVEENGYIQYLLESETITSICIDSDNRKWFGTERAGAYLFSADGKNQILHFTKDNSPLFSNYIVDIKINEENREVFFATGKGIISCKNIPNAINDPSVSSDSFSINFSPNPFSVSTTIEFPNPSHSNYNLSIFNISGSKVFEFQNIRSDKIEFERGKLPGGVYIVELKGEKVFRGKIVIE